MSWERRWHPLRREWVTITSHRQSRPWSGADAFEAAAAIPAWLPDCYLCPRNARVSGAANPDYASVYVFDNDHPSFSHEAPQALEPPPGIYRNAPATGTCRVVCYSPRHDLTLAEMGPARVADVIECWQSQTAELTARPDIHSVLAFENKGTIVGVSNPHPHGQIYAPGFVFPTLEIEARAMAEHLSAEGTGLFEAIIDTEERDGRRIVAANDDAIAFIPWFARFPYEVYVAPRRRVPHLHDLTIDETIALAHGLSEVLVRLDNLWQQSFPYMLINHQAPCDGRDVSAYHAHIQIHPPLRQPGLQKFLAGVETGGGHFLNDASPDDKAAELRAVPVQHYRG